METVAKTKITLIATLILLCFTFSCEQQDEKAINALLADQERNFITMKENVSTISLTVFPIVMGGTSYKDVAEIVALFLEKANIKEIDVADEEFLPLPKSDIQQTCDSFSAFIRENPIDTDYALFGEYVGTPQTGVKEVRCIVVDREGKRVWVDHQTPEDEHFKRIKPNEPMGCSYLLVERLRTELGLPDPLREDAPEGKWSRLWNEKSGVPSENEFSEMKKRRNEMRKNFKNSKMLVFPLLIAPEVSKENAVNLVRLLNEKNLCLAEVAEKEISFEIKPSPNELKMLWDLARKFRSYIEENKIEADYALYGDYFVGSKAVGAVHFILCDRGGEWVIVDLQNEHHGDFQSVSPKTAFDCDKLVVKRLESYLKMEK